MKPLGAQELLDVADQSIRLNWVDRGLLLARYASAGALSRACEDLPLAIRDRLILGLRIATFGPQLSLQARCGGCGEQLEAELDGAAMLASHLEDPPEATTVHIENKELSLRMPTSRDLDSVAGLPSEQAHWGLLRRCLADASVELDDQLRSAAAAALESADPFSALELELVCQQCGKGTVTQLDLVSFVLSEITDAAHRVAAQIHQLALAYGWTEAEILQLPEARRRRYLQFITDGASAP
ncbi:hypothetical protein F183_A33540 [Bryobacterales bacterium F-183]|nr:hypothetical protein F183_A33540 [Bryobacterales bacterium F-183]